MNQNLNEDVFMNGDTSYKCFIEQLEAWGSELNLEKNRDELLRNLSNYFDKINIKEKRRLLLHGDKGNVLALCFKNPNLDCQAMHYCSLAVMGLARQEDRLREELLTEEMPEDANNITEHPDFIKNASPLTKETFETIINLFEYRKGINISKKTEAPQHTI